MHIKINWPPEMQYWNSDSPRKNAIKTATEFGWQTGEYPVRAGTRNEFAIEVSLAA